METYDLKSSGTLSTTETLKLIEDAFNKVEAAPPVIIIDDKKTADSGMGMMIGSAFLLCLILLLVCCMCYRTVLYV